jgi:DNA repair exonuclease SbcCD ATPase subunit
MNSRENSSAALRQQRRELLAELSRQTEERKRKVRELLVQASRRRDQQAESERQERQSAIRRAIDPIKEPTPPSAPARPAPVVAPVLEPPPAPRAIAAPPRETESLSNVDQRITGLEAAFAKLVQTVTERLDYGAKFSALEAQVRQAEAGLAGIVARLAPLENKCEVLRGECRSLEASGTRVSEQLKGFDQLFASLGRDAQKLSSSLDALAAELRQCESRLDALEAGSESRRIAQASELGNLQDRLGRLESGLLKAIGLLQSSEQGMAELGALRERMQEMEAGYERMLASVRQIERSSLPDDTAEREATAKVLASLTRLVQGMRATQAERQTAEGMKGN